MRRVGPAEAHCYVYVLACRTPRGMTTYVGWTKDLDRRVAQHNAGTGARTTRGREWVLIYAERYDTPREAMQREWRLKRDRAFRAELRHAQDVLCDADVSKLAKVSANRQIARRTIA